MKHLIGSTSYPKDRLQRPIVPDGTTQAPREKFDPSKPLIDDDDISP
jgi:hypothetical protein